MKDQYDFSNAKRGPVAPAKGKTRITIMLDDIVLQIARERADHQGIGYQTLINGLLRDALGFPAQSLTVAEPQPRFGVQVPLDTLDRQQIEALEAQLNSMAKSLHALLSPAARGLRSEPRQPLSARQRASLITARSGGIALDGARGLNRSCAIQTRQVSRPAHSNPKGAHQMLQPSSLLFQV